MKKQNILVQILFVAMCISSCGGGQNALTCNDVPNSSLCVQPNLTTSLLQNGAACSDLSRMIIDNYVLQQRDNWEDYCENGGDFVVATEGMQNSDATSSSSSSGETIQNSQVTGVIEPDTSILSGNIVARVAHNRIKLFEIGEEGSLSLLSTLSNVVSDSRISGATIQSVLMQNEKLVVLVSKYISYNEHLSAVLVYDVSNPRAVSLSRLWKAEGANLGTARLNANMLHVQFVADTPLQLNGYYYPESQSSGWCSDNQMTDSFAAEVQQGLLEIQNEAYNSLELSLPTLEEIDVTTGNVRYEMPFDCSDIYFSDVEEPNSLTFLLSAHLTEDTRPEKISILNSFSRFYFDGTHLAFTSSNSSVVSATNADGEEINSSTLHLLEFENGSFDYQGSALVQGFVRSHWHLYADDQHVSVVSEVTEQDSRGGFWVNDPDIVMLTNFELRSGELQQVGMSTIIESETVFAVRTRGDKVFIVTYPVAGLWPIDPLFVIDNSDLENPRVLGRLEMPGFLTYLDFNSETQLLGIGMTDDLMPRVTLMDVSDFSNPYILDERETSEEYNWVTSSSVWSHLDVNYDSQTHRLFLPIFACCEFDADTGSYESVSSIIAYDISSPEIVNNFTINLDNDNVGTVNNSWLYRNSQGEDYLVVDGAYGLVTFNDQTGQDISQIVY